MAILMLYNSANIYTVADIQKATNIPEAELHRHLLSLAHPKVQILKKNPNNRSMASDHKFLYNMKYESKVLSIA
jgi:hypothetical protein